MSNFSPSHIQNISSSSNSTTNMHIQVPTPSATDEEFSSDESSATQPVIPVVGRTGSLQQKQIDKVKVDPWVHFFAGGVGGMTGALFTCPLDVVKTRLQSDFYQARFANAKATSSNPIKAAARHFGETFSIIYDVYKIEGTRALFKGLGPNLVGVIPARSINFFTYGLGKDFISNNFNDGKESPWVHLLAAANAGIVTSTATNPIWLVKTRLQLDKNNSLGVRKYKNSWDCIVSVCKNEGIRGLYKGLSASYLGATESTIQWVLYEQMRTIINQRTLRRQEEGVEITFMDKLSDWGARSGAAGFAKMLASILTYPHEVVRTRLRQAPMSDGRPKYTGLVQCFKLVLKEEGLVSMYGGLTPHLLRTVPNSIIMFGTWELIIRMFSKEKQTTF